MGVGDGDTGTARRAATAMQPGILGCAGLVRCCNLLSARHALCTACTLRAIAAAQAAAGLERLSRPANTPLRVLR